MVAPAPDDSERPSPGRARGARSDVRQDLVEERPGPGLARRAEQVRRGTFRAFFLDNPGRGQGY